MYLIAFPLLLIPFAFFNIVVFLLNMPLSDEEKSAVFELPLASEPTMPLVFDHSMPVTIGDFIVAVGILLLYVEVLKAVRPGGKGIIDHVLAFILFIAMAGELVFVPRAASPTLLLLAVLGFVDFIAGVSIRPAQSKIVLERHGSGADVVMAISAAKKQIRLTQRLIVLARQRHFPLPQSSSASRVTASLGQHAPERGLADHKRITPAVVTVQFDEVEGVEEYALVSAVVADEIERGNAAVIASDSFAVDNAGARAQSGERINDQREAAGEVIAGLAVEPHPLTILAGNDAESIVLDLMQP